MRPLICRRAERRRASQCGDAQSVGLGHSSKPGIHEEEISTLGVPVQTQRRGSLNTLTVPEPGLRRRSYSGPSTYDQLSSPSLQVRRKSTSTPPSPQDTLGFNPFVEKLNSSHVIKVILGMMLLFFAVLLISLYRLMT